MAHTVNCYHRFVNALNVETILRCSCGWEKSIDREMYPAVRIEDEVKKHELERAERDVIKTNKQMIYLASPHSHISSEVRQDRYQAALECTSWLISNGFWVFSPIVHDHNLLCNQNVRNINWEFWKEFDTEMITRCDEVWVLMIPGTIDSKGVRAEIEIAKLQGKRINVIWKIPKDFSNGNDDYNIKAWREEYLEDAKTC